MRSAPHRWNVIQSDELPTLCNNELRDFIKHANREHDGQATGTGRSYWDMRLRAAVRVLQMRRQTV